METRKEYSNIDWKSLAESARIAARNSYSPYSHYRVGAALLGCNGVVYTGCNVENASYGLTNCAERTAIFKAVAEGCREFVAIVIAGGTADAPAYPCGACRQVLSEFCPVDMPVGVVPLEDRDAAARIMSLGDYLPFSFK